MTIQDEYTEEELETKLGLRLATPEEIKAMEDNHKASNARFHSILRKADKNYFVLIYGFKKSTIHLGMVLSTAFDGVIWCWNLWYKAMAGYVFEDEDKEGYDHFSFHPEWKGNPWAMPVNFDEVLKQEETLKYVPNIGGFLIGSFQNRIVKGIKTLLKYPHQVEMLQKIGYPEFATNPSNLKKSPKEILKYIDYAKHTEGLIAPTDIQTISWNIKRNKKPSEAWTRSEVRSFNKLVSELNLSEKEGLEVYKYLIVQSKKRGYNQGRTGVRDYHIAEYKNYLEQRTKLGWSNEDHSARFPSDFEHAYEETQKAVEENKAKVAEEELKKYKAVVENELTKKVDEINKKLLNSEYSVMQPYQKEEFSLLSDVFDNCVGRCGYFKKQIEGNCLIYAIKKDGNYYACLEVVGSDGLKHSPKIKQLYLAHNRECDKETRVMVNKTILPIVGNYFAQPSCN